MKRVAVIFFFLLVLPVKLLPQVSGTVGDLITADNDGGRCRQVARGLRSLRALLERELARLGHFGLRALQRLTGPLEGGANSRDLEFSCWHGCGLERQEVTGVREIRKQ